MSDIITAETAMLFKRNTLKMADLSVVKEKFAKQIAWAESIPPAKPWLHSEEDVEKGVQMYRELHKQKGSVTPTDVVLYGNAKMIAKQMMYMDYITKAPEHLGFPVDPPPFADEGEVSLSVHHALDASFGNRCRITINLCQPWTRRISMVVGKTFSTSGGEAHIQLPINHLVNECRTQGPPCLQFIIEGAYLNTESNPESETKPGPFFTKRIEVWSKNSGYYFSNKSTVDCWPQSLSEVLETVYVSTLFDQLLDRPNRWQYAAFCDEVQRIDISVGFTDGPPPSEVFDFNKNYTAIRKLESYEVKNMKMLKEVVNQFKNRLAEMEKVMSCTRVDYEPKCGRRLYVGIECVVCRKLFRTVPELLSHLYTFYPNLAVTMQRIGDEDCKFTLSITDPNISVLGRQDLTFLTVAGRDKRFDFMKLMMRAQCGTVMFKSTIDWEHREMLDIKILGDQAVMCHICHVRPHDYAFYMTERKAVLLIVNKSFDVQEKCFWIMLKSFLSKTRCHGLDDLGPYAMMRMFLHCHELIVEEDVFDFTHHFEVFLKDKWDTVFENCKLTQILTCDLGLRTRIRDYSPIQSCAAWMYNCLWEQKESYASHENKDFSLLKEITSGPLPTTDKEREEVMLRICDHTFSGNHTSFKTLLNGMNDNYGQPIYIPKCLYFGAAQEEEDVRSYDKFYKK